MPEQSTHAKILRKRGSGVKHVNSTAEAAYPATACFAPGSSQIQEPVAALQVLNLEFNFESPVGTSFSSPPPPLKPFCLSDFAVWAGSGMLNLCYPLCSRMGWEGCHRGGSSATAL